MQHRHLIVWLCASLLGTALAQGGGAWRVESEFDLYSFQGLGSLSVVAFQAPADLDPDDAVLVLGCDAAAPRGVEVSIWTAPLGAVPGAADGIDIDVLVRFDQGPILTQGWFMAEGYFATEAVAYYAENDALLDGLARASTLAVRIQADPGRGIDERTFQFDVSGFATAFASLRCGEAFEDAAPDAPADLVIGSWTFDGDAGMIAQADAGVVALYCSPVGPTNTNGIDIEVGDYELTEASYEVSFRSGNIDFLRAGATRNEFAAAQLDGDDLEDRLVRFLRGVVDLTVTLTPRTPGTVPVAYTVPTTGFNEAFARLGCYQGGR